MNSIKTVDEWDIIEYKNEKGIMHREDGPALETPTGYKEWRINGNFHREDGPARIWTDGFGEYWLNDVYYTKEDWDIEVSKLKLKRIKDL